MTDYFTAEQVYQSLKEENAALQKFCHETQVENETLRTGYAAARLEIESLQARIKTMAEVRVYELAMAHLDGMCAAQVMPESIRSILVRCRNFIDTTKVPAYPAGADLADEIDVLLAAQPAGTQQPTPTPQADSQPTPAAVAGPSDTLRGDTTCLVQSIIAMLELDAEGALVPHGIGGHARALLSAAASRLAAAPTTQPAPQQEPSHTAVQLAELVLSDCGHSSNYTPLLDRVAARIDSHVERRLDELRGCLESKPAPQPLPASQENELDTVRLDWLDKNIFHREMSDWDAKYGHGSGYNMWVMFAPKGHQGSARNIIDAARNKQGANHD